MVFCRGELNSIKVIKDALDTFSSLSGLTPNLSKCSVFISGASVHLQQDIASYLGVSIGSLPIKYLGVPLISTRLKASDCHALVDRILRRIKVWTNRFLSYAGRLQLIQSVLFSIQSYWSAQFILPAKVTKEIESILSAFLWNGVSLNRHGAKVSWADLSTPKDEGGLGIKKVRDWNAASLSRLIWLLCQPSPTSLWAAWVKLNLLHKEHFWVAKVPWSCSWTWRKILKMRGRVKSFISVDVGNGDNTSLWFDSWRPQGPICSSPHARVITDSGLSKDAKVSAIISSGTWMWPAANSIDLINLKGESCSLPSPDCSRQDKTLWDGSSGFSIKRVWNTLRSPSQRVYWAHLVWFKLHVPRHSFILWLAIKGRLPTQDRLLSFGILGHMTCSLCQGRSEDHGHLFFSCPFSARVWQSIATICGLAHYPSTWERLRPWISRKLKGSSLLSCVSRLAFGATVYFIWNERNYRMHGRPPLTEKGIVIKIMDSVRLKLDGAKFPRNTANLQLIDRWQFSPSLLC